MTSSSTHSDLIRESLYTPPKSWEGVECRACGRTIRNRALALASHGRMHVRRGEATEVQYKSGGYQSADGYTLFYLAAQKVTP
jgi:hypothetical protein